MWSSLTSSTYELVRTGEFVPVPAGVSNINSTTRVAAPVAVVFCRTSSRDVVKVTALPTCDGVFAHGTMIATSPEAIVYGKGTSTVATVAETVVIAREPLEYAVAFGARFELGRPTLLPAM